MELIMNKTKVMKTRKDRESLNIRIKGTELEQVKQLISTKIKKKDKYLHNTSIKDSKFTIIYEDYYNGQRNF